MFIVLIIVAIAAFSLGVYVGEHGWTAGPPSIAGPGGPPKGPAVVCLLARRDSRREEAPVSHRRVASRGNHRQGLALTSRPSAHLVTCPPESRT